jgi:hypothetical protein
MAAMATVMDGATATAMDSATVMVTEGVMERRQGQN